MKALINSAMLMGAAIVCYLIGSIPSGFLVAYAGGIGDIRTRGSGNIGATNVSRSLGWWSFPLVFLLDAGKAYLALFLVSMLFWNPVFILICAFCVLLGNCYSVFLGFQGGKGVATVIGLYAFLFPYLCCVLIALWIIAWVCIKRAGIASVIISLCALLSSVWLSFSCADIIFIASSSALIIMRHYSNIRQYLL